MRKVVEKKGSTYEEAVAMALAELGIPRERAQVVLLHARDTDRRTPGPEEYIVRVWERAPGEEATPAPAPEDLNVPPPPRVMCEKTAPTFEDAVRSCLEDLGITEDEADIQMLQRQDTNPLRPGPEKVTVRVWRRRLTEPAPTPGSAGAERISEVHAAAHLPDDTELSFEDEGSPSATETTDTTDRKDTEETR